MAPLPDVQLSYGPMLIGVFFNMILYGVLVGQVLTYYQVYYKDGAFMRYFVGYLFVVETFNTGLDMAMMFQPLVLEYGRVPDLFPVVFFTEPMMIVLVSTPIQIFFAWRICAITRTHVLPVIIGVLAGVALAGGLWTAYKIALLKHFARKPALHHPALVWFLASAAADVLITGGLVRTLSHRKTGFVATDGVIDRIIRTTIQTGFVTAVFSILDVICFMVFPTYSINFVWDLALSKLYSNALLSTLNARAHLRSISSSHPRSSQHAARSGQTTHNLVFEDMAALAGTMGTMGTSKFEEMDVEMEMERDMELAETGEGRDEDITETPRYDVGFRDTRAGSGGSRTTTTPPSTPSTNTGTS